MSAIFSNCGKYRYRLDRAIGDGPPVAFLLHNPSTADASADDRTSKRGIGFARSWGYGRLTFINVWARVATKPRDLWIDDEPVGPLNDEHIIHVVREVVHEGGRIVASWGKIAPPAAKSAHAAARVAHVIKAVRAEGAALFALKVNGDGSPKHPLYVAGTVELAVWTQVEPGQS